MTRYTTPDNLPAPDDYTEPSDSPLAIGALADATQTALTARAPASHTHPYAPASHTHPISQVGITAGTANLGTLSPGQERTIDVAIPSGKRCIATVRHTSTYLMLAVDQVSTTVARINLRNSTTSTTHTNCQVNWIAV